MIRRLGPDDVASLGASWRPGCPVDVEHLSVLELPYTSFDGTTETGQLVIHSTYAEAVAAAFMELHEARFPIARMRPVDAYGGDDGASMADNNTSGFNCREVAGSPGVWSEHAYGAAVDINPVQNPYVSADGSAVPAAGADFVDREATRPGMVLADDVVVDAFRHIGWSWGGHWSTTKDYQHFSATGQ